MTRRRSISLPTSDLLVDALATGNTYAMIPPRRKRRYPRVYDPAHYAQRYPIEQLFSRLNQFRRVATRYDKLNARFLAFIRLAAIILWLRDCKQLLASGCRAIVYHN